MLVLGWSVLLAQHFEGRTNHNSVKLLAPVNMDHPKISDALLKSHVALSGATKVRFGLLVSRD